jgi:PhnB protein
MTHTDTAVAITVAPYLCASPAAEAIDFYKQAFGAEELSRMDMPDGRVGHAEIRIGESLIMLADEWPEYRVLSPRTLNGNSVSLVLSVPDADAAFRRAVDAGATIQRPLTDEPYGRSGRLIDPFGHRWHITGPTTSEA